MNSLKDYNTWIASIGRTVTGLKGLSADFDLPVMRKFKIYYQKCLYISLVCHDLIINLKHFDITDTDKSHFEANYFGRTLALQVSEIFENVYNFTGKEVLQSIQSEGYDQHLAEIKKIGKAIGQLRNADGKYVGQIRNKVGAHKDPDISVQISVMSAVDNLRIGQLGFHLFIQIRSLAEVYLRLMNDMAGMKG